MAHTATAPDLTELASRLRLSVTRLARKLRQEAQYGISLTLLSTLSAIDRAGRITIGELCAAEQVQPPTTSRAVAGLEEAGLVSRQHDQHDRRVSWLHVTPEGRKLLQRSRRRKEAFLAKRLRELEPAEIEVLEHAAGILEELVEGAQ
ncbi:MAG TPA: MarR family transcriptional regulator [Actinomycetota bacterium]|jgi:DNA-binding MarR family transcriptional regulator|nr:MarR family transcriptional regulator [Actinomycetota bacterium]